jgi:hypothetical protein
MIYRAEELRVIGLDPGRGTGVAVWKPSSRNFVFFKNTDFWGAVEIISGYASGNTLVVCENPNINAPPVFPHKISGKMSGAVLMKMAQEVGRNKEQAFQIIQYLRRHNYHHISRAPVRRRGSIPANWLSRDGKLNQEGFNSLTGFKFKRGSMSQHERDAGILVFGFTVAETLAEISRSAAVPA